MNKISTMAIALSVVALPMLTSCRGRMLLHGSHGGHLRSTAAAPAAPVQPAAATTSGLRVFFVQSSVQQLRLVPVERKPFGADKLSQAVEELLSGPSAGEERAGLGTEIPRGTILLGVRRNGRNVELNLSRRFAMTGGTTSFETRLEQLRRTVSAVAGQADVYLSVEGKRLNMEEGEGIEVPQPINR